MMMARSVVPRVVAFFVGAVVYLGLLIGCLGAEAGSSLSDACGLIGGLLKSPMLHFLPYASSKYLGIDSFALFITFNGVAWGVLCTLVVWVAQWHANRR
mgnify:CR=1 FL=1